MSKGRIMNVLLLFLILVLKNDSVFAKNVPAVYVFGDSLFDSGNNNLLPTLAKANYKPYGAKFSTGPTGRFTNGRTLADFTAEALGLPYAPPYVKFRVGPIPVTGLNYASGSCGILPETGYTYGKCLNLEEQINLFSVTTKLDLAKDIQSNEALSQHLSNSIFLVCIGSNDYINNYLVPLYPASKKYDSQTFANLLIDNLSRKLEKLYRVGARKVLVFELGPLGCIPSITRLHKHEGKCVEEINNMAKLFNDGLAIMLRKLTSSLPGSTFSLGHIYPMVYDSIMNPPKYGLEDASDPCCKTWINGTQTCIPLGTPCTNMDKYFFWDGFHLTEAALSLVANRCINDSSVCQPTIQQLVQM